MEVHKNSFEGGLNTNISKAIIPPNNYIEANNVNIAGTGNFFALENIQGSSGIASIIPNAVGAGISGVFEAKFKVNTIEDVEGLVIFSYTSTTHTIWGYTGTLYKIYEETVTSSYTAAKPVVHAISYPESGFDILYFTDNYHEIRKLKCEITAASVADPATAFLTEHDLKVIRQGANGSVTVASLEDDGTLFCGSYQIAYQLVNPDTNQFTKFSLFSNPIHVFLDGASTNPRSGVGLQSKSSIRLTIELSDEELAHYTHFRLAVLENIEPSDVASQVVQLTKIEEIADYLTGNFMFGVYYANNSRIESIPLSDVIVDTMAIETVKTLAIRDNRLIGGNITYKDLSLDNGTPAITGGSILKQTGNGNYDNLFCDPEMASVYRGYFRDEVYRFAISYFDKDGNFSYPSVLDLSAVTHNQITGTYKDMKFPSRSQNLGGTTYTLFSATEGIQSLGLSLTGIKNHPTWAKGFVILRAERLKNIIFQTPIIPLTTVNSIGAVEKYPFEALEPSGATTKTVSYAEAQPMGPFTTYMPRNYFHLPNRWILRNSGSANPGNTFTHFDGEAYYSQNHTFISAMIYPPTFMYEDKPFVFNPNFELQTIDAALTKGKYIDFTAPGTGSTTRGLNIRTSIAATFHALLDTQYYYDASHNGLKASIASTKTLTAFEPFNNLDSGTDVTGLSLFKHDKFVTDGITWGTIGAVQKNGAVVFDTSATEINYDGALTFAVGSQISHVVSDYDFYKTDDTLVHTIEIANLVAGLDDARYGPYDTPHDFISTGAIYTFSDIELAAVEAGTSTPVDVSVWGGDCYTVPHLFKISDTVYGITNPTKYGLGTGEATSLASVQNWERAFNDDSANQCAVSVPVPFKNAAQYVQVVLESEYNASVMDTEIVSVLTTAGTETTKIPVYGVSTSSESACRVPLTYRLNPNHKKTNSDKIFQIKDPLLEEVTNLRARFIYSDQKVYQTSITGFDTFRVLNFKDLQEGYGDITRLEVLGDYLYAIQEDAISYIGIGERTLETTDALTLAVQSGNFIGNIITVANNVGSQHIGSITNTGNALYFIDNVRQTIYRLSGKSVTDISEKDIQSTLRTGLEGERFNNELLSFYDPTHKQVWFVHNGSGGATPFCYIFDESKGMWVANYQFAQSALQGGAFSGGFLYVAGINSISNNLVLEQMYEGTRTILLGTTVTPNVKFVVNPKMELGKTFDDILIPANDRLATIDFTVSRESGLGDQSATGISLDVTTRGEGNYRAKILRDSAGARLRGTLAVANLKWSTGSGEVAVAVPSVLTKYRLSENKF